ncbi:MAG: response regulator [Elusimicrobiota bacterium]
METLLEEGKSCISILIADDEENIQKLFTRILKSKNYNIVKASDGREAVEKIRQQSINLALVDINMPLLSGLEVVKKIKEISETTEVIVITGDPSLETVREAISAGAGDYLSKPFSSLEDVSSTIEKALEKQKLNALNKELLSNLKKRVFELELLYQISETISYNLDYEEIFKLAIEALSKVADFEVCVVFVSFGDTGKSISKVIRPISKIFLEELKEIIGQEINKLNIETGSKFNLEIKLNDGDIDQNKTGGIKAFLNLPICIQGKTVGVFHLSTGKDTVFEPQTVMLINTMVNQTSIAVERLRNLIAGEKNKMMTMVEGMSEGVIIWNESEELLICNPMACRMLALEKNELSLQQIKQRTKSINWEKLKEHLSRDAAKKIVRDISIGEPAERFLRLEINEVKSSEGKSFGSVMLVRDITKEKEIDRMKTEFISNVSHELRTPLTSLREIVSQQLDGLLGEVNERQKQFFQIALSDIDRLGRMIDEILDVSKIEAGKMELHKQLTDLRVLGERALGSFLPGAGKRKIALKQICLAKVVSLYVDKDRLMQVLTNLLGNGLKFTPDGGEVVLEINNKEEEVEFSVTDSGIGIARENISKLFSRFQQVDQKAIAKVKGSGLGLYISRQIVELHRGKIRVESEPGKGSKFIFVLPKKIGKSILIVDDEKDLLNSVKKGLTAAGYDTAAAYNGREAIAAALEKQPNLILLDLKMPDVSGYEVIGRLKGDLKTCNIPIVIMSGYSIDENEMQKLNATALPALAKPFSVEQLLDIVYKHVRECGLENFSERRNEDDGIKKRFGEEENSFG